MSSSSSKQPDSLKFFSPQRNIFKSSLQSNYTPNRTTNYKSVLLPEQHSLDKSLEIEKKVDKVYEECKSEISILKQKFQKIEDSKTNISQKTQKTSESPAKQEQITGNFRGLSPFKSENSSQDMNLVLKEWKIKKTNELIEKFEAQTQGLLRENEKLAKLGKQKQLEIDRLKSQSFSSSCKLKEYESKLELLREELEQTMATQREKEEEIEGWKMRYFENEQKLAVFDSMEFKLLENEYLIMDYQKRLEGGEEQREKTEYSMQEGNKITSIVEQIEEIHRKCVGRKNEDREPHKNGLNLSFQTPEKNRENGFDLALVQLRNIEQFIRDDMENFIREETQEGTIKKLEKELEMERREKVALNSRIMIMKNKEKEESGNNNALLFKSKEKEGNSNNNQETERLVMGLKADIEKSESMRNQLIEEREKMKVEKINLEKKIENINKECEKNKENQLKEIEESISKLREWEEKYNHGENVRSDLERKLGLEAKNKQEIHDLKKIIASNNEKIREIERNNEEMRENLSTNDALMKESNEFKEAMKLEIEKYNKELTEKRKRINELERGFFQSQQLEMALQKAKLEIASLNEEIKENSSEKQELLRKMEELESLRSQNQELIVLSEEMKRVYSEKEGLIAKLKEKEEIIRKISINNEELSTFREKTKDLSSKLLEMDREMKELQAENIEFQEQSKKLQEHNKELQNQQLEKEQVNKKTMEREEREDSKGKEEAMIKLEEELNNHQRREKELQSKIESLENTLERKLRETSDIRTSLEAQLRQQATLIEQLKTENHSIIANYQRNERDLQVKTESLERELRETLETKSRLEQELSQQADLLRVGNSNIIIEPDQIKDLQRKLETMERDLKEARDAKKRLEIQCREQVTLIEQLKGENNSITNTQLRNQRELQSRIESLERELIENMEIRLSLENQLREQGEVIEKRREENNGEGALGYGNEIVGLREENMGLKLRNENLGREVAMLQKEMEALKGEIKRKKDEISGSGQEVLALRGKVEGLRRENEEMKRKYEERMKEIEGKIRENERNGDIKGGLEENNEKFEIRNKELDKIVEGLKEELENERKKAKGFKDSLEKTRSETKMLFLLGVAVIICISLFFFIS